MLLAFRETGPGRAAHAGLSELPPGAALLVIDMQVALVDGAYQEEDVVERLAGLIDRLRAAAGLGLAIARQLARLHGGDLAMTSKPEVGTTVTLYLPESRIVSDPLQGVA